jgi:hypothetical protein
MIPPPLTLSARYDQTMLQSWLLCRLAEATCRRARRTMIVSRRLRMCPAALFAELN